MTKSMVAMALLGVPLAAAAAVGAAAGALAGVLDDVASAWPLPLRSV